MICEILGLFVNTLITDEKYSLHNIENLAQPIQIKLSKKQETSPEVFALFLKYTPNFKHFEKKYGTHS